MKLNIKASVDKAIGKTYHANSKDSIEQVIMQYYPDFVDSSDTVVLFDEIQESSEVFNLIRTFTREFATKFIVTGSYLGKLLDNTFVLNFVFNSSKIDSAQSKNGVGNHGRV